MLNKLTWVAIAKIATLVALAAVVVTGFHFIRSDVLALTTVTYTITASTLGIVGFGAIVTGVMLDDVSKKRGMLIAGLLAVGAGVGLFWNGPTHSQRAIYIGEEPEKIVKNLDADQAREERRVAMEAKQSQSQATTFVAAKEDLCGSRPKCVTLKKDEVADIPDPSVTAWGAKSFSGYLANKDLLVDFTSGKVKNLFGDTVIFWNQT